MEDVLHKNTRPQDLKGQLEYSLQIASAIVALHGSCVMWYDAKPENVLIGRDEEGNLVYKLCDFGLAVMFNTTAFIPDEDDSGKGVMMPGGTYGFMAPKQILYARVLPERYGNRNCGERPCGLSILRLADAARISKLCTFEKHLKVNEPKEDVERYKHLQFLLKLKSRSGNGEPGSLSEEAKRLLNIEYVWLQLKHWKRSLNFIQKMIEEGKGEYMFLSSSHQEPLHLERRPDVQDIRKDRYMTFEWKVKVGDHLDSAARKKGLWQARYRFQARENVFEEIKMAYEKMDEIRENFTV
uniref:Protein kinase domain-containing protein n=1 Tax=Chromera velia CCMP2878 TaxID=1169474 RepID=A0A0G4HR02_9ALVE|eukprot:Cvel_30439.t1-p1 / transcript=Cvel_30439.t1 / gene=Cvel_30439 / organism=Chromera_velia_CCMP2878 / gene_product=hypothetical protein / transcript_product=hypothetical protein / location=Cvel_scaffold4339:7265-9139(-) / protein_length=296 / sequence_SO=supercontig / SO=protein_coding / is_pseudo=false